MNLTYTCIGKGGTYELIGTAKGAGVLRDKPPVRVYRDVATGNLYFRSVADFAERMKPQNVELPPFEKWDWQQMLGYNQGNVLLAIPKGEFNSAIHQVMELTMRWKASRMDPPPKPVEYGFQDLLTWNGDTMIIELPTVKKFSPTHHTKINVSVVWKRKE